MKIRSPMLAVCAAALAICSAFLFASARKERERVASEHALRLEREAEIRELKQTRSRLERQIRELQRAAGRAPVPAPMLPTLTPAPGPEEATGTASPASSTDSNAEVHFRKFHAASTYGELAHELGLSVKQTDELFALMAEPNEPDAPHQDGSRLPTREEHQRLRARLEAKAIALLGHEKAAQFRAYQESLPQRLELRNIRQHLELFGAPIRDDQKAALLKIMNEERDRIAPPVTIGLGAGERFQAWQEDESRRVRERAGAVLSAGQLQRLEEYHHKDAFGGWSVGFSGMAYSVSED